MRWLAARRFLLGTAAAAACAAGSASGRAGAVRVPILMYHKVGDAGADKWWVSRAVFEEQLDFLRAEGYATVLPGELAEAVERGAPLPPRPLVITFDDGYRNLLTDVEPLLAARGFRAIAFLPTAFIGPDDAGRRDLEGTPCLTWEEVRLLLGRGTLAFGSHGRAHRDLRFVADAGADLRGSREDFVAGCGRAPDAFCYPFGRYREDTVRAVRAAGFRTAVTCDEAVAEAGPGADLLRLPRVHVVGGPHAFALRGAPPGAAPGSAPALRLAYRGPGLRADARLRGTAGEEGWAWTGPLDLVAGRDTMLSWPASRGAPPPGAPVEVWDRHRVLRFWRGAVPGNGHR